MMYIFFLLRRMGKKRRKKEEKRRRKKNQKKIFFSWFFEFTLMRRQILGFWRERYFGRNTGHMLYFFGSNPICIIMILIITTHIQ